MTPERKIYAHPKTHEFLKAAMADGAHQKNPPGVPEAAWVRQRNMVGSYYAFPATLEKLGDVHGGITRERVRNIIIQGVRHLWQNSSGKTRRRFPFSEIKIGKPPRPKPLSQYSKDSKVIQAARLKGEGKGVEEIKAQLGLSASDLSHIRQTLAREGIELGYLERPKHFNNGLAEKLSRATSDEEIQSLFPLVKRAFLNRFLNREDSPLISLFRAAWEGGCHLPLQKSGQLLKVVQVSGLPLGVVEEEVHSGQETVIQRHHFIAGQHKKRLIRLLRQDETMRRYFRNPVSLAWGQTPETMPTTGQIQDREKFRSPAHIFSELGLAWGPRSLEGFYRKIFSHDCPVPIFSQGRGYFYPREKEGDLREFVKKQIGLGLNSDD